MGRGSASEDLELPATLAGPRSVTLRGSHVVAELDEDDPHPGLQFTLAFTPPLPGFDPATPTYAPSAAYVSLIASPFGPYLQLDSRELDMSFFCGLDSVPLCTPQPCVHLELYRTLQDTHGPEIAHFLHRAARSAKVTQPQPYLLRVHGSSDGTRDLIALCDDLVLVDGDDNEYGPARSQACVLDGEYCVRHPGKYPDWSCSSRFFVRGTAAALRNLPQKALLRPELVTELAAGHEVDLRTCAVITRAMGPDVSARILLVEDGFGTGYALWLRTGPSTRPSDLLKLTADNLRECGLCAQGSPAKPLSVKTFPCARHPQLSALVYALRKRTA